MATELEPDAVDAVLDPGGTAVLALARDDRPYAVPVSYGYDPGDRVFYLRLGIDDDTEKRDFLADPAVARLVVYGEADGRWTSVVAEGRLEAVDADAVTRRIADRLRRAAQPLLGIWDDAAADVEFRLYRLDPDTLSGRTTTDVP